MKFGTTTTTFTSSGATPAAVALLALTLGGCSAFAPLTSAPDPAPPAPPPPPIVSKEGLAPITEEQVERIRGELAARTPPPAVAKVVRSASPTIESFVRTEGCITARNGAVLNPFAAPGRLFDSSSYPGGPMQQMQYHDKTACVTVKKIQNWKMVSPKLVRFDVIYVGDDGQERATKRHELTRQPKGGWLFTK